MVDFAFASVPVALAIFAGFFCGFRLGETKGKKEHNAKKRYKNQSFSEKDENALLDWNALRSTCEIFVKGKRVWFVHRQTNPDGVAMFHSEEHTSIKMSDGEARQLALALNLTAKGEQVAYSFPAPDKNSYPALKEK